MTAVAKHTFTLLLVGLLALTVPGAGAEETAKIFSRYKDHVAQIQLIDIASNAKSSIGSGFQVTAQGLVVTNFHVVSALIYHADRYAAKFVYEDGRIGDLTLRAIDVVHDLAILEADGLNDSFLTLSSAPPSKGERLYAFGNPHDLGMTIVEGTYNGLLEKSIYDKIHFTASINPGMSGGPTLDRNGLVVGVNVSTAGNQLSFLVPATYVSELVERVEKQAESAPDFVREATDQLLQNQDRYVDTLLQGAPVTTRLGQFEALGKVASFLSCWGDTQEKDGALYEWAYQECSTSDDLFLSENQSAGVISFTHEHLSTSQLGQARFFGFAQERFQVFRPTNDADEEMVGNFECQTDFVEHQGTTSKVVFCLRAYKKFDGLFDAYMKSSALASPRETLQSTLSLAGVSFDNATRVARRFLESIRWNR